MKIAPLKGIFDQRPCKISYIRSKLSEHVRDNIVLSPEGAFLVTPPR